MIHRTAKHIPLKEQYKNIKKIKIPLYEKVIYYLLYPLRIFHFFFDRVL